MRYLALWGTNRHWDDRSVLRPGGAAELGNHLAGIHSLTSSTTELGWEAHAATWYRKAGIAPDVVLFVDIPRTPLRWLLRHWPNAARWVVLLECDALITRNGSRSARRQFDRVFTWDPTLAAEPTGRPHRFAVPMAAAPLSEEVERPRFATMIAANKKAFDRRELYSQRRAVIDWYDEHAPDRFDLYGPGWDQTVFGGPAPVRALNLIAPLRRALPNRTPVTWRGPVDSKFDAYVDYRFAYCYENATAIPGYITEKIFDALSCGTIPIYWGDPAIDRLVPSDCFISRTDFESQDALDRHLVSLDATDRKRYIDAARTFLHGDGPRAFEPAQFASPILQELAARG